MSGCADSDDARDDVNFGSTQQSLCGSKLGHRITHFGTSEFYFSTPKLYQSWFLVDTCTGALVNSGTPWTPITVAANGRAFGPHVLTMGVGMSSWDKNFRRDAFYISDTGSVAHVFSNDRGSNWGADDWGAPSGYNLYGQMGVASWGSGRVDVFVLGKTGSLSSTDATGNSLFHRSWDNGSFSAWQNVGPAPYVFNAPSSSTQDVGVSAVSWGPNRIDVFARGYGSTLAHWYSTNGTSFGSDTWPTGYAPFNAPDVASWGDQRLDVYYERYTVAAPVVTDQLKHLWWDHGGSAEDDWGTHNAACSPYPLAGTRTGLLGAAATTLPTGVWIAPSWSCGVNSGNNSPLYQFHHRWTNAGGSTVHAWQEVTPSLASVSGMFAFSAFGDGAVVVSDL